MKKKTTFLAMAVTAIAFALAGCHSNKEESEILRPISENFVGRWKLIDNYLLDENGKRVEDESDDNVSEMIVTFRPDEKPFKSLPSPTVGSRYRMPLGGWTKRSRATT